MGIVNKQCLKFKSLYTLTAVIAIILMTAPGFALPGDIADRDISRTVESELLLTLQVPSHLIDVETRNGIVTLSGITDHLLASQKATEIAESIKGVRAVINKIDVRAVPRSDGEIKEDIQQALVMDPAAESYDIQVKVEDGRVTLDGVVQSWTEKDLAENLAAAVLGVKSVDNQIIIEYREKRSDEEIEEDVKQRLSSDVWIDHTLITVSVSDGIVKLKGAVGSARERSRAKRDAWVTGTNGVDITGLEVKWWAEDEMQGRPKLGDVSDSRIERTVMSALKYDPRLKNFDIEVTAKDGVVTLTGVTDNLAAKKAAEQDAENVKGVLRVKNYVRVRPEPLVDYLEMEKRIREALARDPYLELTEIRVSVYNGKIYLRGETDNYFEKKRAGDTAAGVKGAMEVVNQIDYREATTGKDDWQIRSDVISQLFWNPYVNGDEIDVSVDNGSVTLTGTVNSLREKNIAEDQAFDAGAALVVNKLEVN